jgi:S-adenosylmethionine synthetase
MIKFSEYVSLGHPDKVADYISQYLLDRYIEQDPDTRYAVEVQIKDSRVTLGGEVSSKVHFSQADLDGFVRCAVCEIGYNQLYQMLWGRDNAISGVGLTVLSHISQQSPDIAQGLSGWGDQGIFFGMATTDPDTEYMPYDHSIAKRLCKTLYESGIGGLDIKTQVLTSDNEVRKVIVAIPLLTEADTDRVEQLVRSSVNGEYSLFVNGTGRYIQHSTIADCGTTGRKLAVDFYGGNCKIGGGAPWTKDGSKADLTLNLLARQIAKHYAKRLGEDIFVSLACCIGRQEVDIQITNAVGQVIREYTERLIPAALRECFKLNTPIYASMCRWGLFGEFQTDKQWEQ